MERLFLSLLAGLVICTSAASGHAAFSLGHYGAVDPTREGFITEFCCGMFAVGPEINDLGHDVWNIHSDTQRSYQAGYYSGALSPGQKDDVESKGFALTLEARVLQGVAPVYDSTSNVTVGGAAVDTGTSRFEIGLGVNSSGDTVVVLPTSIDPFGPGGSIRTPGPSYTLAGLGSSYHTYQLVFSPETRSANLFIDGTEHIRGYTGDSSFHDNKGLKFGGFSGGSISFAQVQLVSPVPEPSAGVMMGFGFVLLMAFSWFRRMMSPSMADFPALPSHN